MFHPKEATLPTVISPISPSLKRWHQSWHQFIPSTRTWSPAEAFGGSSFPRQAPELGRNLDPGRLAVVTWNVDAGAQSSASRLEAIISCILGLNPVVDIIFLQEVSKSALVHLLKDTRIREAWYSSEAHTANWGGHLFATMTLLSKARFGNSSLGPIWRVKFPSRFDRDALCCDVLVPSQSDSQPENHRVRLVNVHLDSLPIEPSKRPQQLSIAADILREAGKGFVAGDFNPVLPEDDTLVEDNGLVDAWVKAHGSASGHTWGVDGKRAFPPGRLDKVAMLGLQPHEVEIIYPGVVPASQEGGDPISWSDHCGLSHPLDLMRSEDERHQKTATLKPTVKGKAEPKLTARPLMTRSCPVENCDHESPTDTNIRQHIQKKHPDVPPFGCTIKDCQDRFRTIQEMIHHTKAVHPVPRQTHWPCHVENCDEVFSTKEGALSHITKGNGITPDTVFVTWHLSTLDLTALREWLEEEGQHSVLPPDDECVPVIQHFRGNLEAAKSSNGRRFPVSLPVIFPVVMGTRHHLYGRNHHVAIDAQQLQCMVEVFNMLCKPSKDRPKGWLEQLRQAPDKTGLHQPAIEQFLNQAREKGDT
ncbi:hypothetical protein ACJZ2D_007938 [Fusarium nematophilum]